MDKEAVLKIISRFRLALEGRGIRLSEMILFGSYATGNFHEGSDIDLIVISEDFEGMEYWDRINVLALAICDVFEPIEAIAKTPQEWLTQQSPLIEYAKTGQQGYLAASA